MTSKVIGTVYQTPNNSGQFASGRCRYIALHTLHQLLLLWAGGNKSHVVMRRTKKCQTNT